MVTYLTDPEIGTIIFEGDKPSLADLLHFNVFTEFQRKAIEELLDDDSGPDEFVGLVSDIKAQIWLLEQSGWEAIRENGDAVTRPTHYDRFPIEPTYYAMMTGLDWCRGNALKYLSRYPYKNGIEDLKKAARYVEMYVKYLDGDSEWSK